MNLLINALGSLVIAALITGCVTPKVAEEVSAEFAAEGLHKVSSSGFDRAYMRPDANFPSYRAVAIMPLQSANATFASTVVSNTTRQDWQMTEQREANLASAWAIAMDRAFTKYARGSGGEPVLQITAELVRVIPGRTSGTSSGVAGKPAMGSMDTVDIEMEFRFFDQANSRLLAVIRDSRTISTLLWTQGSGAEMGNLFNSWAGALHHRVSGK